MDANSDEINEKLSLKKFSYSQVNIPNLVEWSEIFSSDYFDDNSEKNRLMINKHHFMSMF
jgi:hypothetical protein